jgi:hypothetical protein
VSKRVKMFGLAALVMSLALLPTAVSASAATKSPTGDFAVFSDCPTENPLVKACFADVSTAGGFQVGKIDVPIVTPVYLQGGLYENEATSTLEFVPAADGKSLAMKPEEVPGGIFSVVNEKHYPGYLRSFCKTFPKNSTCKLTGVVEGVGFPVFNFSNLLSGQGTAVEVPLRLHLKNPLLGARCYIGSPADPIIVQYTTGTTSPPPPNTPITGALGAGEGRDEGSWIGLAGNELVDNAFAAPGAEGCGGPQAVNVDREMNKMDGLPSPAGYNTTKLGGSLDLAAAAAVVASE